MGWIGGRVVDIGGRCVNNGRGRVTFRRQEGSSKSNTLRIFGPAMPANSTSRACAAQIISSAVASGGRHIGAHMKAHWSGYTLQLRSQSRSAMQPERRISSNEKGQKLCTLMRKRFQTNGPSCGHLYGDRWMLQRKCRRPRPPRITQWWRYFPAPTQSKGTAYFLAPLRQMIAFTLIVGMVTFG